MLRLLIAASALALTVPLRAADYLIPARNTGKWGYIDPDGIWEIPARFDEALSFSEGLAAVKYYGKWGYIDRNGEWEIEPAYWEAKPFSEGLACAWVPGGWGFIDRLGQWQIQPAWQMVSSFDDGRALVKGDDGYRFIDRSGQPLFDFVFEKALPFTEGMAFVVYDGQRGYIDRNGNWLIRHEYDEAYSFSGGRALIRKGLYYGFIDVQGHMAIGPRYQDAAYFKEGLAAVKYGGSWGYIDPDGETVISPAFEQAFPFSFGLAVVKKNGRFGLIDREGEWVLSPGYQGLGRHSLAVDFREEIGKRTREEFARWLLKGEYEKTAEYRERISEANRLRVQDSLVQAVVQRLARTMVPLARAQLGPYNADLECFEVFIPGSSGLLLPVPLAEAPSLREYWNEVTVDGGQWQLTDHGFVPGRLQVSLGEKSYVSDGGSRLPDTSFRPDLAGLGLEGPPQFVQTGSAGALRYRAAPGLSDVDHDLPAAPAASPNTFALIIGNEDYSSYHGLSGQASNAEYAATDARIFREYAVKTLGIPAEHITLLINATAGQMRQAIARLNALSKAYEGEAHLVVYYAGHGLPHPQTSEPYLLPVDLNGSDLGLAVRLQDLYAQLTEHPSRRVTVFLDACFSGPAGPDALMASRGVRIRPKSPLVLGNLVVFSASSGDQASYPFREKAHGMFTYYLLKALQTSGGRISYGELAEYLHSQVQRSAILINDRRQEPRVEVSPVFEDCWQDMQMGEWGLLPCEPALSTGP
jgi:hypothetical protein